MKLKYNKNIALHWHANIGMEVHHSFSILISINKNTALHWHANIGMEVHHSFSILISIHKISG